MTTNSFVAFVPQQHNTRGDTKAQEASEQSGAGFDRLTRTLATVDAWLWIVFALLIVAREVEQFFGVLSGFTLLVGPYPTMVAGAALILGGAAYLTSITHAGPHWHRLLWWLKCGRSTATATVEATATARVEATAPQPEWKVRTQPRPQAQRRSTASQRVMDMEL